LCVEAEPGLSLRLSQDFGALTGLANGWGDAGRRFHGGSFTVRPRAWSPLLYPEQ
jgi:hypothetical protein